MALGTFCFKSDFLRNVKCVAHHSCQVQRAVRTTENAKDIFFREAFEDAKFVILSKCGKTTLCIPCPFSVLVATSVLVVRSPPRLYSGSSPDLMICQSSVGLDPWVARAH